MLHRAFAGMDGVRIEVPAFEAPRYRHVDWWRSEHGVIAFQNEVMKYLYYRVMY
jgi:hypothetical protein